MNKRLSRKDIRQPDAFVSFTGRLWTFLRGHRSIIMLIVLLGVVAGVITWGLMYQHAEEVHLLSDRLAKITKTYSITDTSGLASSEVTDLTSIETDLQTLYEDSRGTELESVVTTYLFNLLLYNQKYDAAITIAQQAADASVEVPSIHAVALYRLGLAYEASVQPEKALATYQQAAEITDNPLGQLIDEKIKNLQANPLNPVDAKTYLGVEMTPASAAVSADTTTHSPTTEAAQ